MKSSQNSNHLLSIRPEILIPPKNKSSNPTLWWIFLYKKAPNILYPGHLLRMNDLLFKHDKLLHIIRAVSLKNIEIDTV